MASSRLDLFGSGAEVDVAFDRRVGGGSEALIRFSEKTVSPPYDIFSDVLHDVLARIVSYKSASDILKQSQSMTFRRLGVKSLSLVYLGPITNCVMLTGQGGSTVSWIRFVLQN